MAATILVNHHYVRHVVEAQLVNDRHLKPIIGYIYQTTYNNNFLCVNIVEDQAQWRDKTKGLSNLVIGWMKVL